ncbi:MAG: RdgB/HAM1 family non-canonical purine NTP pyrophosphatase [Anaerolineales bacterium]
MSAPIPLLLATHNPGKRRELQALLADLPLKLILPSELGLDLHPAEEGQSYAENALHKAVTFARASGLLTLADDSGLEVDALQGAPGLHSARYHPRPAASDAERRALLLANLRPYPRPWTARFRATIALTTPEGETYLAEGICEGEIIPEARGTNGFGYDPIFLLPALGRTMAELDMAEKNRISHRARAIQALRPILMNLLPINHSINQNSSP